MKRRTLLAMTIALAVAFTSAPTYADDDNDDGTEENSDDDTSDGETEEPDDGEPEDTEDGGGGDDGGTGGEDVGTVPPPVPSPGETSHEESDHEYALGAVTSGAMALKDLLERFRRDFNGKVIDVALMRSEDSLRYRIKFVDSDGRVRRADYDAVTGQLIK